MLPAAQSLIAPYEWVQTTGPRQGHITRPVVYALQHQVLPDSLFTWHPELAAPLRDRPTMSPPFLHMWSKAKVLCDSARLLQPGVPESPDQFWQYASTMATAMQFVRADTAEHAVWILSFSPPKAAPDCHYVALCKPKDETDDYLLMNRSERSRYFALESAGTPGVAYFCQWHPAGNHANHGVEFDLSIEHFQKRVHEALVGQTA